MLNKIKSKYILNTIFENVKKKKKLDILKFNKKMQENLSINKEDFLEFIYVKILKEKYKLNLNDDVDTKELNLSGHPYIYIVLLFLKFIQFKKLKEINLSSNLISEPNVLEFLKTEKLEILDLRNNRIKNIGVFEKLNFKELKNLDLCTNYIDDINVFEKVKKK